MLEMLVQCISKSMMFADGCRLAINVLLRLVSNCALGGARDRTLGLTLVGKGKTSKGAARC